MRRWAAILAASGAAAIGMAATAPREQALETFQQAEEARKALEATPSGERTRQAYQKVVIAYRRVYRLTPQSSRADDSLAAEADLYVEMSKRFDPAYHQKAVDTLRFLIEQYPHSPFVAASKKRLEELEAAPPSPPVVEATPAAGPGGGPGLPVVMEVRHWSLPELTRVIVTLQAEARVKPERLANPSRLYFDIPNSRLHPSLKNRTLPVGDERVRQIRVAQTQVGVTRVVLDLAAEADYQLSTLPNPPRLVLEVKARPGIARARPEPPKAEAPKPEAAVTERAKPEAPKPGSAKTEPARTERANTDPPKAAPPKSEPPGAAGGSGPLKTEAARTERARPLPPKAELAQQAAAKSERAAAESKRSELAKLEPPKQEALRPDLPKPDLPKTVDKSKPVEAPNLPPPKPAQLPRREQNLIRALGLKISRVVIDAGHGGHDTGTIGPTGLMEKDLCLDVARRLGDLIAERIGAEVIYTRTTDEFVALEERTALANEKQADLFISIHANSSRLPSARGIETYYLSLRGDREALEVAARENAASSKSIHELQDLVTKIALTEKIAESREFAEQVQKSLFATMARDNGALRNRGVRKAPFVVLIGARMPSVLAEISFLSNPRDEKLLKTAGWRQRVAEALYSGVAGYARTLSRVEVASRD